MNQTQTPARSLPSAAIQSRSPQPEPAWPDGKAFSLPQLRLDAGRAAILSYFENTWRLTETLFSGLVSEEAYYLRPYHHLRHPLVFYYAHPVTFYVNKLLVAGLISAPLNRHFEQLFETGVDEMSWDDLHEGQQGIWPPLADIRAYRAQVYALVRGLIQSHPVFDEPVTQESPAWALVMCFEHERIHLETSSVLMRELPLRYLKSPVSWPALPQGKRAGVGAVPVPGQHYPEINAMIEVPAQGVELGKPRDWPAFGWDNEYGHEVRGVSPFRASEKLISNGEFYEFVRTGAYLEKRFWSDEGWEWRCFRNTRWPSFWVAEGPAGLHQYRLRTIFSTVEMQWDWPAVVNCYEARAYCAWLTERDKAASPYRLMMEKEHLALSAHERASAQRWLTGDTGGDAVLQVTGSAGVNHNLQAGSEGPVDASPRNSLGFRDVQGNVWQWSDDVFHALPGFHIHPYYADFSVPCFDGRHQMILGSSFISTGNEASVWSRFHFRPHFFQHAGFRIAQDASTDETEQSTGATRYESDALLNQYMLFHWGSTAEQRDAGIEASVPFPGMPDFFAELTGMLNRHSGKKRSMLDLGCAVGRATLELTAVFERCVGIDFSQAFVDAAKHLQSNGSLTYHRHESGRFHTEMQAFLPAHVRAQRAEFLRGDACDLKSTLSAGEKFDAVLMSNLLCRLPDPAACLQQFSGASSLLRESGVLLIASPNSWMEQYTAPADWLDSADSAGALNKLGHLLPDFELLESRDLPLLIREHRRKYEFIITHVSVWRRLGPAIT